MRRTHSLPRISVVTPSFNQAQYLEQTILSVLGQNYPNLEYIVIDGGSTDGSVDILRKYERDISYWVSEKDHGQAAAIQRGFSMATGEIFGWLNSDDYYLPEALSKVADAFGCNPAAEFVIGGYAAVRADGKLICKYYAFEQDFLSFLCVGQHAGQMACFWRKSAYVAVGGIDPNLQYCMDYDLMLRLARRKDPTIIDDCLACFRLHDAAKTAMILQAVEPRETREIRARYGYAELPAQTRDSVLHATTRKFRQNQRRGLIRDVYRDPGYFSRFLGVRVIDAIIPGIRKRFRRQS